MDQDISSSGGAPGSHLGTNAAALLSVAEGSLSQMDPNAARIGMNAQHLASSGQVANLLPQLPSNALFPAQPQQQNLVNQAIQQARYAMLLQAAGTLEQQASASNPLANIASLAHHLNNQTAYPSNHSVAASITTASTPTLNSAAQLLATHSSLTASASHAAHTYHNQSLASLENQVKLLQQLKQPVPQTLALLLADARRREEKKHAKRIANRKSASTSRARKKALVQEMTDLNARLRRQALILSLLPDLVIVTDADGVINFCSEQVERVLRYTSNVIVGNAIEDLLVPSSRDKMKKLIKVLVASELSGDDVERTAAKGGGLKHKEKRQQVSEDASEQPVDGTKKKAKLTAAPLSVVEVDAGRRVTKSSPDETDNSDASRDSNKLASSLTGSTTTANPSDSDDNKKAKDESKDRASKSSDKESGGSDDNSHASSLSLEGDAAQDAARKLQNANANLERNVRWHNKNMKVNGRCEAAEFKDDVIGATVTANNASARLSSLRVHESEGSSSKEDKNPLSEEDSGYRESNDSREETSSSTFSDTSSKGGRRKPLAPTCNVCLIRDDLSTLWCEVTSSIRTRYLNKEDRLEPGMDDPKSKTSASSNASESESVHDKVKEIYLCLRPIRPGRHNVDEKLRFPRADGAVKPVSEGSKTGQSSAEGESSKSSSNGVTPGSHDKTMSTKESLSIPPKKRTRRDLAMDDMMNSDNEENDVSKKAKAGPVIDSE